MKRKMLFSCIFMMLLFQSKAQSFKAMTYNIRLDVAVDGENDWTHRKDFFVAQINFYEPDVMGVQEATPNQIVDLDTNLAHFKRIGIGREGQGRGEASAIYYNKNRFVNLSQKTFWLSETPEIISKGWDAAYNRVCTYGLFKDLKTKKLIWIFNTHLDHLGELARTNGIDLILKTIEKVNTKNYPVIFMGDLNSEPNTDRIINLKVKMIDTKLVSVTKPFGPSGTFNNFRHDEAVLKLIDYIFISKNSKFIIEKHAVLSDAINLRYPSDHLPVLIQLRFLK